MHIKILKSTPVAKDGDPGVKQFQARKDAVHEVCATDCPQGAADTLLKLKYAEETKAPAKTQTRSRQRPSVPSKDGDNTDEE